MGVLYYRFARHDLWVIKIKHSAEGNTKFEPFSILSDYTNTNVSTTIDKVIFMQ